MFKNKMSWLMQDNELLKLEIENLNNKLNRVLNNNVLNKIYNDFDYLEENIFHDNTFKNYIRKLFFEKDKIFGDNRIDGPYRFDINTEYNPESFKDDYYFFKFDKYDGFINHKRYEFEISNIINIWEYDDIRNIDNYINLNYKNFDIPNFNILDYILLLFISSKKEKIEKLFDVDIIVNFKNKFDEKNRTICIIDKGVKNDWRNIIKNFINVKFEIYNVLNKLIEKDKKNSNNLKTIFEYKKINSYYRGYQEEEEDYNSDHESWYNNCYFLNPKENKDLNKYLKYSKLPLISKFSLDSKNKNSCNIQVNNYLRKNEKYNKFNDEYKKEKMIDLYKDNNTLLYPSNKIKIGLDNKLECDIICIYKNEIKFLNNFNIIHKFNFPKDYNITNISILENDNFLIELNNNGILYELNIFTKKINLFFCKTEAKFN